MASASLDLLNRVRAKWAEDIDPAGAWSDDLASGVLTTFKRLQLSNERATDTDVHDAVWTSSEGSVKQRRMAADVWDLVAGEPATARIHDLLKAHTTVEDLTAAAEAIAADGAGAESAESIPKDAPDETPAPAVVDWAWSDSFAAEYGRDPRVAEYVYLRPRVAADDREGMRKLAETHASAYAALRGVHKDYLGFDLSEAQFARSYVPAAYDDAGAVAEDTVHRVTESPQYAAAMRARLSHLHELLFDVPLTEDDAKWLFEQRVRAERMPLTTDHLDGLVTTFREEADEHAEDVRSAYQSLLGRTPTAKEAKKRTSPYRRDAQSARAALLTELVAGLEFADVVRRAVLEVSPDMEAPDVFAAVARVVSVFPSTVHEGDGGVGFTLEGALDAEIQKTITQAHSDE